jgi:hypothetical protein
LNIWLLLAAVAAVEDQTLTNIALLEVGAQVAYYLAISMHRRVWHLQ